MNNSRAFRNSKEVFQDIVDSKDYVQLDRSMAIYHSLKDAINKPLKMILVFGKPGTGKSMMLNKLYKELAPKQKIVYIQIPIIDEVEFFKVLAYEIFQFNSPTALNFTQFMEISNHYVMETTPVVILDEAQLYSESLMEKIRLISDSRKVKFIFALHKTEKEDLIAKEHFKTRIWESQELQNATASELMLYIQKKLLRANFFDIANMFSHKSVKHIHQFTHGNYRDTNKLLYTLFEICSWYEENRPTQRHFTSIPVKYIEMAAIHTGFIDA
ncbi:MAG: ATP-binding protein [Helicobacteraceae bacterium]|jgi:4-hydroxy-tetrahydrodipicolinate synthase|nr:ATP-binding protein [Helicobacteraceae bacterium]